MQVCGPVRVHDICGELIEVFGHSDVADYRPGAGLVCECDRHGEGEDGLVYFVVVVGQKQLHGPSVQEIEAGGVGPGHFACAQHGEDLQVEAGVGGLDTVEDY